MESVALWRNAVRVVLLVSSGIAQIAVAIIAYLFFYNSYLPDQITTFPLHLQYGYGVNPYAVQSLQPWSLKFNQPYDVLVTLSLPRSPANTDKGNFMVALRFLRTEEDVTHGGEVVDMQSMLSNGPILATFRRAALIPYVDPMVDRARRLALLPYHVLWAPSETSTIVVTMAEKVVFDRASDPKSAIVELEAGQILRVKSATITLVAQLGGLQWLMYHHWILSFMTLTTLFWVVELGFTIMAWAALKLLLRFLASRHGREQPVKLEAYEEAPLIPKKEPAEPDPVTLIDGTPTRGTGFEDGSGGRVTRRRRGQD